MAQYERLLEFYQAGPVPWDQADPPPEVLDFVPTLPVGRALDLGCGLGRATIFLARLGWQADGVDFIAQAVVEATRRAQVAGVADRAHFYHGAVDALDFLSGAYDFALDVGCAHNFDPDQLQRYHAGLLRLLRPGASYLLFAHLNEADTAPEDRRWLDEAALLAQFADGFTLTRVEFGQTQVGDQAPWRSAWFWFERNAPA